MKILRVMALCSVIHVLAGCGTSPAERSSRSDSITATGLASIENYPASGLKKIRIFMIHVDGELLQSKETKGVYPLSPGQHELHVICQFSRMTLADLIIDAGDLRLRLEAEAGFRYRLQGQKLSETSAEVWIEDVANGQAVVPKVTVPLNANPQNVPVIIPIPVNV